VSLALDVPTIGIGAGAGTDGQVLVWHDMLGMYAGHTPRFVKRYAEIAGEIGDAVAQYASEVRTGAFPEQRHTYGISADELARFDETISAG
jgi:3-methyl-2-oxobutanoate hydroxymethyltransferase